MALLLFFAAFVLAAVAPAAGQRKGFLSIDCGLEAGPYTDKDRGIDYVPDGPYVDAGENHAVASELKMNHILPDLTVRSFPSGVRNCYTLPTIAGTKYLVRVVAFYGNYDGMNNSSGLQFNLHLGTNYWDTVQPDRRQVYEALFVAWASWAPVCLVNINQGTPFASSVELRPLGTELYPTVMANQSIRLYSRIKLGPTTARITRYPNDLFDRYWWPNKDTNPMWKNFSTTLTNITLESSFQVPVAILENAVEVAGNGKILNITWRDDTGRQFAVFLHFADFQNSQVREFDFHVNSGALYKYSPRYLAAGYIYSTGWYRAIDGEFKVTLAATAESVLPPMLNAYEIYTLIIHDTPTTFPQDADAIMAIKLEYGIKKNWAGDPCFPIQFKWDGVECRNISDNIPRIIAIDLSNSNLHGVISSNFTLLTALDYLNLSGNQLNGPIPDSLCKLNEGSLIFSYGSNGDVCNKINLPRSKKRAAILAISIAAPVLVVVSLFIAYLIWRAKGKSNISAPRSEKYHWDRLRKTENRHFTYEELKKLTDNFQHFIGEGGFGCVYRGYLEDNTEVAVKIRSEKSSHGFNEFLAEVESLTKVRHKNLVSLVGYCWEKAHLALVYEYMPRGNLFDLLRGDSDRATHEDKTGLGESLNWAMRVRVLLDAAQGLDYLHTGCNRPIIHRDVKTSNILLDQNLQAKIADFGLSKSYLSDTQSGILATVAGTIGYIDPVYHTTGKVTESSDVYSFGVVLLEVATGQRPILQGNGHIIQRVKEKVASGDISSIADERLKGDYNVSSMWKVVEIALLCTDPLAAQRPSMTTVVVQMKESLALEVAREDRGLQANPKGDAVATSSTFDPSAR